MRVVGTPISRPPSSRLLCRTLLLPSCYYHSPPSLLLPITRPRTSPTFHPSLLSRNHPYSGAKLLSSLPSNLLSCGKRERDGPVTVFLRYLSSDHNPEGSGHHRSDGEGEGEGPSQLENILISVLVMLLLTATLEYFTVTPEVSFSFFQQHMLSTGEVSHLEVSEDKDKVFVYLHRGAIVNGKEAKRVGPQYVFTISSVDSLETKLNRAQDELGIPPSGRVPLSYKAKPGVISDMVSTVMVLFMLFGLYTLFSGRRGGAKRGGLKMPPMNPF